MKMPGGAAFRTRGARVGLGMVAFMLAFAIVGPFVAGRDPAASDFVHGISANDLPAGPSFTHLLGCDRLFRDQLARLAEATRFSLAIGVGATVVSAAIGTVIGIIAGYTEETPKTKWVDSTLMTLVDVGLSFPFLLLVMALAVAFERLSSVALIVTLGATGWLHIARIVRAKTMQVRSEDYVLAARAQGQSVHRILRLHIFPNVVPIVIGTATFSVAQMILAESALSYLGAGVAPPTATWGHMLFEGQEVATSAPWLVIGPAAFILLTVFGFNLLGEGLRDAQDSRSHR